VRLAFYLVLVLWLCLLSLAGCGTSGGTGGGGGVAGAGGVGGAGAAGGGGAYPCTEEGIRSAIAAGGGPHFFACDGPTTVVTEAEIAIDSDVILDGEGNLTVDGNEHHVVFSVGASVTAELHGLTVTGGVHLGPIELGLGGGIVNSGTLTLTNSSVSGNSDGGILNAGTLTLTNSTASNNTGSGIYNDGTLMLTNSSVSGNTADIAQGGGVDNSGTLTLTNSTASNNTGSGIYNDGTVTLTNSSVSGNTHGGIFNTGTLTLTNSTVPGNTLNGIINAGTGTLTLTNSSVTNNAAGAGGGIFNTGTLTLTNSTVSGNTGGMGSIFNGGTLTLTNSTASNNTGGGIYNEGTLTLTNSTVSGNTGGGITNLDTLTLTNSTVSGNDGSDILLGSLYSGPVVIETTSTLIDGVCTQHEAADVTLASNGYNIESPGNTCGFDPDATDQVNVAADDLKLGPLQENGGPTQTHALGAGSVAIDQIPVVDCVDAEGEPLSTDQRGEPRPGGTMCDVGAFEVQP
jgi:hypothetical protein